MRLHQRWVKVDGYRTRYVEAGDGDPIVLVHGGGPGASWTGWRNAIPALAEHFRVIGVDMLGFGETDKPALSYDEWRIAEHLGAFVDTLSLDPVRLMGNSKGAYWAARFMVDHPAAVRSYCAVGSNTLAQSVGVPGVDTPGLRALRAYDGSVEKLRDFFQAILTNPESESFIRERHRVANLPGAAEMRASNAAAGARMRSDQNYWQAFSLEARLPRLTLPMLLIWGAQDRFAPVSMAHDLVQRSPNVALRIIQRAGHQCQNDDPATFNRMVVEFFTTESTDAVPVDEPEGATVAG
jgi:pimeloyl-ACP methyl ester carboxylesterase